MSRGVTYKRPLSDISHGQGFSHEEYSQALRYGYDDREIKQYLEANPEVRASNNSYKHSQKQSKTDFQGGGGWYDTMLKGSAALDAKDDAHQARLDKIRGRKGRGIDAEDTEEKASEAAYAPGSSYEQKFNEAFQKYQKQYDPAEQKTFNNNIQFKRTHSGQSKLVNQTNHNAFKSGGSVDIYKSNNRMAGDVFRPERNERSSNRRQFES